MARATAIFGMIIVNFSLGINFTADNADTFFGGLVTVLSGRASATFVLLAGIGASLGARRALASRDRTDVRRARITLAKRALILLAIGYLWLPLWSGDILHFYGAYLLIGAALLAVRDRYLWLAAAIAVAGGLSYLLIAEDYFAGWDFEQVGFNYFTLFGPFREILFNGLHPVFPWLSFYLVGMWLGRRNLSSRKTLLTMLIIGAAVAGLAELISALTVGKFNGGWVNTDFEDVGWEILLSVGPLPPTPTYLLAAGGTAIALVASVTLATQALRRLRPIRALERTGQLSLTIYVGHVLLGFYPLYTIADALELSIDAKALAAFIGACVFMAVAITFSVVWRTGHVRGPLEAVLRALSGRRWLPTRSK